MPLLTKRLKERTKMIKQYLVNVSMLSISMRVLRSQSKSIGIPAPIKVSLIMTYTQRVSKCK